MGDMLAMPTDPIADACEDAYEGGGMFVEGGWTSIPRAVATDLIPGEDFGQFMGEILPDGPRVVIDLERLEQVQRVETRREQVDVLVAAAVMAVGQRAQAEHWTVGELVKAVKGIADEYRPRVRRLAESAKLRDYE